MYLSIGFLLLALVLCVLLGFTRRRSAIKKVCSMSSCDKCELLSSLIAPFGYCYDNHQDIISSRIDAWQREIGYTALFDRAAASFNMVFDYLPVYFTWQERTWLIEFWKGQYGINTGAEIGVYHADRVLLPGEYSTAVFDAASDHEMLLMSFGLVKGHDRMAELSKRTWGLTAFCMGRFSKPEQLCLKAAIRFPDRDMMHSFLNALYETGVDRNDVSVCGCELQICFCGPQERHYGWFARLQRKWAQFWNRIFCKVYLWTTAPFCATIDRLLYLYYLLPFVFRKMLAPRKYKGCKKCKRCKKCKKYKK